MKESEFWRIIDRSREGVSWLDERSQSENLRTLLQPLSSEQLIAFSTLFQMVRGELYRWDVWEVGIIIHQGMSDSGFEYFREWIVSQGRSFYSQVQADPKVIFGIAQPGEKLLYEELFMVVDEIFEKRTAESLPVFPDGTNEPAGLYHDETELEELYPVAAQKFGFHWD